MFFGGFVNLPGSFDNTFNAESVNSILTPSVAISAPLHGDGGVWLGQNAFSKSLVVSASSTLIGERPAVQDRSDGFATERARRAGKRI